MLSIYLVLNCLIVIAFLLAGGLAIAKNSRATLNRLFFGFIIAISAWVLANYFSNDFSISQNAALVANHLTLFMPGIVLVFLLNFAVLLTDGRPLSRRWLSVSTISLAINSLALTPLVAESIHRQGEVYAITFGPAGVLYFLALLCNMVLIVTVLVKGRRQAVDEQKQRVNALLWGVVALLGVNLATNTLLPALGGAFALTNIGPLSSVFVIYALWYSIVKHQLFDIRFVVARALAYTLSLGSLALIFLVGTYVLTSVFFQYQEADSEALRLIYTLEAVALALIFPQFKRFFDRSTNHVFYRDAYDTQQLLDELNKVLVSNYELAPLLRRSATVIGEHLRPQFCTFIIRNAEGRLVRVSGDPNAAGLTEKDETSLRSLITKLRRRVVVTSELSGSNNDLQKLLATHDVAIAIRLTPVLREEGMGYLLLGTKKSGNAYSQQDIAVIQIIANELIIATQNALRYEEIEHFAATLQDRVTEATRKLRRSNEKLKALDEAKDDFVSMASHQLRTPLTSVKGYISMVLEGDAGPINATQRKLLEQSFVSSQRMVYLIADLLNVSRLKTGKFIIAPTPVNIAEVVEQEIGQLTETAASRQLTLTYQKPATFPSLMLDETKTRQVIMNFVDNAIYYTPAGGHIQVQLVETPTSVEFRVVDDGIGVPKSEQPHLFTKFYRAGNARKARPDGTGLGLFMAKKVIVAQGGAIIFNTEENKGSTFGFVFSKAVSGIPGNPGT